MRSGVKDTETPVELQEAEQVEHKSDYPFAYNCTLNEVLPPANINRRRDRETHFQLKKIIYVYNTAQYLWNFRLGLMQEVMDKGCQVIGAAPYDKYAEKFSAFDIFYVELPMARKSLNPFKDFILLSRLIRLYKSEKPDLVHHFTIKPVIYGSIAAKVTGVRGVVNTIPGLGHSFLRDGLLQSLVAKLYYVSLKAPARVTFENPDNRDLFLRKGITSRDRSYLIRSSGVNTEKFRPASPKSSGPLTFMMVSRMLWDKGVGEFVEAAEQLKKTNASIRFTLVGAPDKGNPNSVPLSWLQELNQKNVVEWINHVEDVRPLLSRSTVVVLPTFYPEGLPVSLIEAAAMGKPIITTDTPGCREIVEDGVNGLLISAKSTDSLVKAMSKLTDDMSLCEKMGKEGRERVLKYFDEKIVINETFAVYRQAGVEI